MVERPRRRFGIDRFCIVADRGMISAETIATLEQPNCNIPYILGAGMRRVKEVMVEDRRYIVCRNARQARKDAAARQAIIAALAERIKSNRKGLVGSCGYARYLKISKGAMVINQEKIEEEARFDGKVGAAHEHEPLCRTGGAQVQGTLAGGTGVPGHEVGFGYQAHLP